MAWLLIYLDLLRLELWPTNLQDLSKVKRKLPRAYFESPSGVIAELEPRLALTGRDGEWCVLYYTKGCGETDIARAVNSDAGEVGRRISLAMKYISGWKRKRTRYEEFVKHKRYRR